MTMLMIVLAVLLYSCAVISMALGPNQSRLSTFELQRRKKDDSVALESQRQAFYGDISGLLHAAALVLAVLFSFVVVLWLGWLWGGVVAVAGVLLGVIIANMRFVYTRVQPLYDRYEKAILQRVSKYPRVIRVFRRQDSGVEGEPKIVSRQEFLHVVETLPTVLSSDERRTITQSLELAEMKVADIMTPKEQVIFVKKDDVVGPLLLDELHKTGHSQFPVIGADVSQILGVLHIRNLLQLHDKKTHKASSLMTKPVHYVDQAWPVEQVLAICQQSHSYLLVVINDEQEVVGIVTLQDALEVLLGRGVTAAREIGL